nr:hypothetical protein [Tanacetum cinerariifolium]
DQRAFDEDAPSAPPSVEWDGPIIQEVPEPSNLNYASSRANLSYSESITYAESFKDSLPTFYARQGVGPVIISISFRSKPQSNSVATVFACWQDQFRSKDNDIWKRICADLYVKDRESMLDVLHPKIELLLKSWGSCCISDGGNAAVGERLSEVAVMLRSKIKNYVQGGNSEIRDRMQPLIEELTSKMNRLHEILDRAVFISTCREYWDEMGHDVLRFLEDWKDNHAWYRGPTVAVSILDETS